MHRWQRSHGNIGVTAPSWLTFEVHRPYFDGAESPITAMQARGPAHAARLYAARDPQAPRLSMVMPASYRQLLIEESRLTAYRVSRPTDLDAELASPQWSAMAEAFDRRAELEPTERAGLAQWLVAACLPDAVLELAPKDLPAAECADPLQALVQFCRATALFQRTHLSDRTAAAFEPLISAPVPTIAHVQAFAGWAYLLARHAAEAADAAAHAATAQRLLDKLELPASRRSVWRSRLLLREVTLAERQGDLDGAWSLLQQASVELPGDGEDETVLAELRRRLIDRRVEIAVKRSDDEAETAALAEGLELDPYCVKIRMQQAQAAERRGDLAGALEAYLLASRLGPYGTGMALLRASACAGRLGHDEFARVLAERAFRAAPRSEQTRAALVGICQGAGDEPLADVVRRAGTATVDKTGFENDWHFQMYGAYFNLAESHSPCLFARLPLYAYEFALAGESPRLDVQRITPPAFRTNLVRESGLTGFLADHPADLPDALRTPAWQQLCDWLADFANQDLRRQYLICKLLLRLGYRRLIAELVPGRPVASLTDKWEFYLYRWRDMARYAGTVGSREPVRPSETFEMVDNPNCPLHLKLTASTYAVVFAARETKSLDDAVRWRERAKEFLDEVLASDEFTEFEKVMLESRFYRGVGFVPFMKGDKAGTVAEMQRAEELARALRPSTPFEELLRVENLHACLESRSKEAFGLREVDLGVQRTAEFLALDPYDPKSHIEMGEALGKQQRYAEAADSYLRTARLGPLGTAIGYTMAGECLDKAGQPTLAEDCFVQALRIDPYAITAARGWRRVSTGTLAAEYAQQLEEWGAARMAQR